MALDQSTRAQAAHREPTDSDVDLRAGAGRRRHRRGEGSVVAAIAAGGALGAGARYAVGQAWPSPVGAFPSSTFVINVLGCGLIGTLMVLVTDVWLRQRLLRPFLGTGVLGGFTTFSTYAVDIERLATGGRVGVALFYLVATLMTALGAVWVAATLTRRLVARRLR